VLRVGSFAPTLRPADDHRTQRGAGFTTGVARAHRSGSRRRAHAASLTSSWSRRVDRVEHVPPNRGLRNRIGFRSRGDPPTRGTLPCPPYGRSRRRPVPARHGSVRASVPRRVRTRFIDRRRTADPRSGAPRAHVVPRDRLGGTRALERLLARDPAGPARAGRNGSRPQPSFHRAADGATPRRGDGRRARSARRRDRSRRSGHRRGSQRWRPREPG
jgi:hypothetical protein